MGQSTPINPLLVREKDLPQLLGVSRATVRRLQDRGAFPTCIRLGRCVAWRRADIELWIAGGCGAAAEGGAK